jgi:hypothetical protein
MFKNNLGAIALLVSLRRGIDHLAAFARLCISPSPRIVQVSSMAAVPVNEGYALQACDHCKARKKKCDKKIPGCTACKE